MLLDGERTLTVSTRIYSVYSEDFYSSFNGNNVKFAEAPSVTPTLQQAGVQVMPNGQCRNFFRGIVTGNLICVATTRTVSPCRVSIAIYCIKVDQPFIVVCLCHVKFVCFSIF